MKRYKYSYVMAVLMMSLFIGCSNEEPTGPKSLESAGEKIFDSFTTEGRSHITVQNDSGGVYIYGYANQDIIETMLYRTVSAETRNEAQNRLVDIQLEHAVSENDISIFTTIDTQPGRLNYSSWYNLEIPNKMVLDIKNVWDDITVFDMDTTLTVTESKRNVSIVRHSGSAQVSTVAGEIYLEIALPDSGYCRGETGDGDIVVRVPQETSATFKLLSLTGTVAVENLEVKDSIEGSGSFEGVLGLGEGEILLQSGRGSITLSGL